MLLLLVCFLGTSLASPPINEEIWGSIHDGKFDEVSNTFGTLPIVGAFPSDSHYFTQGACGGGPIAIAQTLGYEVLKNKFGPAFYDGDMGICAVVDGEKICNRIRVLRNTLQEHPETEYDCVSYTRAMNDDTVTPIQYLKHYAVIIDNQYIGNFGNICENGEQCSMADDLQGNTITYKGPSAIDQNTCFIVRKFSS